MESPITTQKEPEVAIRDMLAWRRKKRKPEGGISPFPYKERGRIGNGMGNFSCTPDEFGRPWRDTVEAKWHWFGKRSHLCRVQKRDDKLGNNNYTVSGRIS